MSGYLCLAVPAALWVAILMSGIVRSREHVIADEIAKFLKEREL